MVVYEPYCESKVKEPIEKMKVWVVNDTVVVDPDDYDEEDRTLCVSVSSTFFKFLVVFFISNDPILAILIRNLHNMIHTCSESLLGMIIT